MSRGKHVNRNYDKVNQGKENPNNRSETTKERSYKGKPSKKTAASPVNDVRWYQKNPQLLHDAASIPFSNMLGLDIKLGKIDSNGSAWRDKLPGLITMPITPSYGVTAYTDANAVNVAAQNVYSFIRHQNSGHTNYDVPDLFMYLAAMDQMYSFHSELTRIYGLMRFYSGYNRYMGRYLVNALGYDYDDLVTHLAQFRFTINQLAIKLSSLAVPAIMPIVERHRWMYANVYMDNPTVKAQLYAFVPKYWGQYIEPNNTSVSVNTPYGYLAAVTGEANLNLLPKGWDYASIVQRCEGMMENLLGSEDIGIMSGDILKAYGASNCYVVNAMPEDYIVSPAYAPEVLSQIHNATAVGDPQFTQNADGVPQLLYQNGTDPFLYGWNSTKYKLFQPGWTTALNPLQFDFPAGPTIIDMPTDSPAPEDIVVATRLTTLPVNVAIAPVSATYADKHGNNRNGYDWELTLSYEYTPVDVVSEFRVYSGEREAGAAGMPIYNTLYTWMPRFTAAITGMDWYMTDKHTLADMSKFDWHPTVYTFAGFHTNDAAYDPDWVTLSNITLDLNGQIENYAVVAPDVIGRIHDTALLSLLDVPTSNMSKGI